MTIPFKTFVAVEAIGIAAMNAGINALYTWCLWRSRGPLPIQGVGGIAFDLASTPIWIAMLSTLLGTVMIRAKLRDGRVVVPAMRAPLVLDTLPAGVFARALVLGATAATVLGLPLWWALDASGFDEITLIAAVLTKVAITVPLSLAVVPLVILAGLADVQRSRRPALLRA